MDRVSIVCHVINLSLKYRCACLDRRATRVDAARYRPQHLTLTITLPPCFVRSLQRKPAPFLDLLKILGVAFTLYYTWFYIHFRLLPNSGDGDAFMKVGRADRCSINCTNCRESCSLSFALMARPLSSHYNSPRVPLLLRLQPQRLPCRSSSSAR